MPNKRSNFFQSLRAQWLGMRMRELRDQCDLTLKDASAFLGVEFSTLARYERAEWPFQLDHVKALLDVYGVTNEVRRTEFIELARHAWRINRWDAETETDDYKLPFPSYAWVQGRAEEINTYGTTQVPNLLQTQQYADALIQATDPDLPAYRVANLIRERTEHQQVLEDKDVPVTAIIEEAALCRPVGGVDVIRGQLEHLTKLARRPNVEIHMLPKTVGVHPAVHGAFTVMRMRDDYPPVVHLEHLGGQLWLERQRADRYVKAYQQLIATAFSPSLTAVRIGELVKGEW